MDKVKELYIPLNISIDVYVRNLKENCIQVTKLLISEYFG